MLIDGLNVTATSKVSIATAPDAATDAANKEYVDNVDATNDALANAEATARAAADSAETTARIAAIAVETTARIAADNAETTARDGAIAVETTARIAADAEIIAMRGAANGMASLGADSKILSNQLPAIAITDTFVVNTQAAMLALAAETGDVAVRTDLSKSFILKGTVSATLSDWTELLSPTSGVESVAGRTGAITLVAADVGGLAAVATTGSYGSLSDTPAAYSLPNAAAGTLGGIKVGAGLAIDGAGVLSAQVASVPYDLAFSVYDKPLASETVMRTPAIRAFTWPANFTGSIAKALTAATAQAVFIIKKNGTQVATITFAAAATTGVFSTQGAISIIASDSLTVVAPSSADATLADIDVAMLGTA